ncbi:MAG: NADH-quinone oxidoreductase subunit M [Chloroflexi bacterium]|nr:NADH-quinone oxidoreductase subunit M [Chloroflexota bacterium]
MPFPILTTIVFLPALGAVVLALLPRPGDRLVRYTAATFTFITFILTLLLFQSFDQKLGTMQFRERVPWISSLNINFDLGVDGLSLTMVLLMGILGFLAVLISWKVEKRVREYFIWLLLLEMGVLGVFLSLDLVLFFLFWEVELMPMYMLISIWGTGRKEYSATKFVLYTLTGSAFMFAGILVLYFSTGQFDMTVLSAMRLSENGFPREILPAAAVFFLLFAAFAVKLPIFPLHTWLPDAHTDAPTAVSVILAGILLKMGGYGMMRLNISIFPGVARDYAPLLVLIAVIGVLYGAAVTLRQRDLKRMIAYSSVSHMGYVLLGIFALSPVSLTGATLQMFSHGVVTGLLFAMVGLVYDKTHLRDIHKLGGLSRQMPIIAVIFSIAGLASLGLPGTSGFAAEFLVFLGSFQSQAFPGIQLYTALGVLGVVLTAGYMLYMLQKVLYGEPKPEFDDTRDADFLERVPIFALTALIIAVGLYPASLTNVISLGVMPIVGRLGF